MHVCIWMVWCGCEYAGVCGVCGVCTCVCVSGVACLGGGMMCVDVHVCDVCVCGMVYMCALVHMSDVVCLCGWCGVVWV